MKKRNVLLAALLVLSLCLTMALPVMAVGSPRIYQNFSLDGIPKGNDYHAVSDEVVLAGGATVTVTGTWTPPSGSLWVGIFDEDGNGRSVCLQRSGDTKSFTVPKEGYYVLQVSSPDFKISSGLLQVQW